MQNYYIYKQGFHLSPKVQESCYLYFINPECTSETGHCTIPFTLVMFLLSAFNSLKSTVIKHLGREADTLTFT
jgi:hypothetical protein